MIIKKEAANIELAAFFIELIWLESFMTINVQISLFLGLYIQWDTLLDNLKGFNMVHVYIK